MSVSTSATWVLGSKESTPDPGLGACKMALARGLSPRAVNPNGEEWNLAEPGSRFRAAAPNHPEALLEEPQAFQAIGEKEQEKYKFEAQLC